MRRTATLSRRSALGLGLLAVAACKQSPQPSRPVVDPDASALASARAAELLLLNATTDAAERAEHLAHLTALGGRTAPTTTPAATASSRQALLDSAESLREAAVAAIDGSHAAVFASIAASHEVMSGE